MAVPWAYTRRRLAEKWGIPPWHLEDRVPWSEVRLELAIQAIEAKAADIKKRRGKQIPMNELE